jgi:pimeloyl-ACP methyl ester carboxylesterase
MMGVPTAYRPTPAEAAEIAASRNLLFPFKPRSEGAVFDGFVSNLAADRFPLEQLSVPTLVINAKDDPLAPYKHAEAAARRIPTAQLVTIDAGGHMFIGRGDQVRTAVTAFVQGLT